MAEIVASPVDSDAEAEAEVARLRGLHFRTIYLFGPSDSVETPCGDSGKWLVVGTKGVGKPATSNFFSKET